jgi:hypothetical protein
MIKGKLIKQIDLRLSLLSINGPKCSQTR